MSRDQASNTPPNASDSGGGAWNVSKQATASGIYIKPGVCATIILPLEIFTISVVSIMLVRSGVEFGFRVDNIGHLVEKRRHRGATTAPC